MDAPYDSRPDTYEHIHTVQVFLLRCVEELGRRLVNHDRSKLFSPEKEAFDAATPRLRDSEYGSEEYKGFLRELEPALRHHYAVSRHHPEHFNEGIQGMNLLDLVELVCDWKSAGLRHKTGDLRDSIEKSQARFGYSDELKQIFLNTARFLDGLE